MRRTKRGGWPYSQPPNVQFELNKDSPQAKGLVAWWPFDGCSIRERIQGYPFTVKGTPSWVVTSKRAESIYFDANTDWLDYNTALTPSPPFTISCWVWLTGLTNCTPVGMNATWSVATRFMLFVSGGGAVQFYANADAAQATKTIAAGAWHHLCAVAYASDSRAAFADGANKGTNAVDVSPGVARTTIGGLAAANAAVTSYPVLGYVSDIRFYNRVLTDTGVYQLYAEPWELYKPLMRRWVGWKSPVTERIPRYGFTNFQVPGIV